MQASGVKDVHAAEKCCSNSQPFLQDQFALAEFLMLALAFFPMELHVGITDDWAAAAQYQSTSSVPEGLAAC